MRKCRILQVFSSQRRPRGVPKNVSQSKPPERRSNYDEARPRFYRELEHWRTIGQNRQIANALGNLGWLELLAGSR
jgi:hypothetical protein